MQYMFYENEVNSPIPKTYTHSKNGFPQLGNDFKSGESH